MAINSAACCGNTIPYLPLKTAAISPAPLVEEDLAQGAEGHPADELLDELDFSETAKKLAGGGGGAGKAPAYGADETEVYTSSNCQACDSSDYDSLDVLA